jgi:hypothetical protein
MSMEQDHRPLGTLVTDLVNQMAELVRTEARLLRAEMQEKMHKAGNGMMEIAAGAVLLLGALLVLLQALVVALANLGLGAGWASLLVGLIVAAIGYMLVRRGTTNMSPSELAPEKSMAQVRRDIDVAKEQVR